MFGIANREIGGHGDARNRIGERRERSLESVQYEWTLITVDVMSARAKEHGI